MAKVTGPLFSISASGQIAKTLVYMNWKGIDDVRKYVIPANPRTAAQQTQRGYFSGAVEEWHTDGYSALDVAAFNLYALALKVAQSGFNVFVKLKVLADVAVKTWTKLIDITIGTPAATTCDVTIAGVDHPSNLYYGTSKTSMFNEVAGVYTTLMTYAMTGLSASTKYYFYIKATGADAAERTGIYSFKTADV